MYAAVIALGDSRVYSGSDAGGKAATVKAMVERGDWDVDVGYWAASLDPTGRHHPLVNTHRTGDRWVQVTSLPMIWASRPLYGWFGPPGLLVIPCLGAVLAAVAARRVAVRLGAADNGWRALWLVGLGTPMLFYAGDFWEHAPAVGLAVAALAVALTDRPTWWRGVVCGVVGAAAIVLRTEVLVYAVCLLVAVGTSSEMRRQHRARASFVVAAAVSGAAALVVNLVVERRVLGGIAEGTRTRALAGSAGTSPGERLRDGVLTTFGVFPDDRPSALLLGVLAVGGLVALAFWAGGRGGPLVRAAVAVSSVVIMIRVLDGLGFVPGALAAAPASAFAVLAAAGSLRRRVSIAAVSAVPLVWLTSSTGLLVPQWGGRYLLLTGVLLTVVAAVELGDRPVTAPSVALLGLVALVSIGGAWWHIERTDGYGRAIDDVLAAAGGADVVVSRYDHLWREAGAWYGEDRWLRDDAGRAGTRIAAESSTSVAVVGFDRPVTTAARPAIVDLLGLDLFVHLRDQTEPEASQ